MREFAFAGNRKAFHSVAEFRSMSMPWFHRQQQTQVSRILRCSAIQPMLEISQPYDSCARATAQRETLHGNDPEDSQASLDTGNISGQWQFLPKPLRTFFESRFDYDFSRVRVHVDAHSAQISRNINARAFTFGQDVFFGDGQYSPDTAQGQRLIAHELTHVVQESGGPASIIRREEEPTRRQIERDSYLRRLAVWPEEAHEAWRRLGPAEQTVVVVYMTGNYGSDFAGQFLAYARNRRRPEPVSHWTNILRETHDQLRQRGYRWVVTSMGIEHWVHPSGNSLHRILPSRRSERQTAPSASSERSPRQEQPPQSAEEIHENPPRIDPSADPVAAYGPVVQSRERAEIMGQNGRAVEYEDGTILLYPEGSSIPVTYRPSPGGYNAYDYYGQDGMKFENLIVAIEPDELFGAGGIE